MTILDSDIDMCLALQEARHPECSVSFGTYVAEVCRFAPLLSNQSLEAAWRRWRRNLCVAQIKPTGYAEWIPYAASAAIPSWQAVFRVGRLSDRFLWQAAREAGAYDESLLVFTRRSDRGGLWSWSVSPVPACSAYPLGPAGSESTGLRGLERILGRAYKPTVATIRKDVPCGSNAKPPFRK